MPEETKKCPKCGSTMRRLEYVFGLLPFVETSRGDVVVLPGGGSPTGLPVVVFHCEGCRLVEQYLFDPHKLGQE